MSAPPLVDMSPPTDMPHRNAEIYERPPYIRPVPAVRFGVAGIVAMLVFGVLLGGWEAYFRSKGAVPQFVASDVLWAMQRARINNGEGNATVLIGSSRMLFDVQLDVWEKMDGRRPIQLALEGTSPITALADLAADTAFRGRLMIGVSPDLFFSGFAYRGKAIANWRTQSLTDRSGQWLSMHLLEPVFAFVDPDFALFTILKRQEWPARAGVHTRVNVRKLTLTERDRNTHMWPRVVTDTAYARLARDIWAQDFGSLPPGVTPAMVNAGIIAETKKAAAAVATLRARGVPVLFIRHPSAGAYLDHENKAFPRQGTWEPLLAQSGVKGIHFADHPELQGFELPEWSHLSHESARRYTAALYGVIARVEPAIVAH